jgi:hypothetical protein
VQVCKDCKEGSEKGRSGYKGERAGRDVHMSNESARGEVQEGVCKCASVQVCKCANVQEVQQ